MSEYIVNFDGDLGMTLAVACAGANLSREEIVRCKDCEFSFHSELFDKINARYCRWFRQDVYIDYGFCFWGRRKES